MKHGLLIEYDYCTGCHSCEVACQQEHNFAPGKCGLIVTEYVMPAIKRPVAIDNLPFVTELCDLCAKRTARGEKPACVKHCQAKCMHFGTIPELVKLMEEKPRTVLYRPL